MCWGGEEGRRRNKAGNVNLVTWKVKEVRNNSELTL